MTSPLPHADQARAKTQQVQDEMDLVMIGKVIQKAIDQGHFRTEPIFLSEAAKSHVTSKGYLLLGQSAHVTDPNEREKVFISWHES